MGRNILRVSRCGPRSENVTHPWFWWMIVVIMSTGNRAVTISLWRQHWFSWDCRTPSNERAGVISKGSHYNSVAVQVTGATQLRYKLTEVKATCTERKTKPASYWREILTQFDCVINFASRQFFHSFCEVYNLNKEWEGDIC